jgi:hypothetical protein
MAIIGTVIIVTGCGDPERSLLSSGDPAVPTPGVSSVVDNGSFVIGFSGLNRGLSGAVAGKYAAGAKVTLSDKGWFSPRKDGKLEVKFNRRLYDRDDDDRDGRGGIYVKEAKFRVRKGSLSQKEFITMAVTSGSELSDIQVAFTEPGVEFHPAAELQLVMWGKLTEEEEEALQVFHTTSNGEVTVARSKVSVNRKKDQITLFILVPGFSTYSPGGDDPPEGETGGG